MKIVFIKGDVILKQVFDTPVPENKSSIIIIDEKKYKQLDIVYDYDKMEVRIYLNNLG